MSVEPYKREEAVVPGAGGVRWPRATSRRLTAASVLCLAVAVIGLLVFRWQHAWNPDRPGLWQAASAGILFALGLTLAGGAAAGLLRIVHADWRRPLSRTCELFALLAPFGVAAVPALVWGRSALERVSEHAAHHAWNVGPRIDAFAVAVCYLGGLLLLTIGLIPDLAERRDAGGAAVRWPRWAALGWRGTAREWRRLLRARSLLNGLALATFVFTASLLAWQYQLRPAPGWHSSIFAPYFALTSMISALAASLLIALLMRRTDALRRAVTEETLDKGGKLLLAFCILWFYFWWCEFLTTWYALIPRELSVMGARYTGPLLPFAMLLLLTSPALPLVMLGSRRMRKRPWIVGVVAALVLVGVLLDRFVNLGPAVIQHRVAEAWQILQPRPVDGLLLIAPSALVAAVLLAAWRVLPPIPAWEVRLGRLIQQPDEIAGAPVTRMLRQPPI